MATVVTLGSATQDIFLLRPDYDTVKRYITDRQICITQGTKNEIHAIHYGIGGGAVNAAVALHRLGHQVFPLCMVGNDDAGRFIIEELKCQRIETRGITISESHRTGVSCVVTCESGDSGLLVYRGANNYAGATFARGARGLEWLEDSAYWYCGPVAGEATGKFANFLQDIRPHATSIAVNPSAFQLGAGYEQFFLALPYIDVLISNAREARMLVTHFESLSRAPLAFHGAYEEDNLPRLMRSFHSNITLVHYALHVMSYGPRVVVITDGANGVYVVTDSHVYFHPAFSLAVSNTVGAGDAFGSTFFGYLIDGETVMNALARAMINSSAVLYSCDATTGLLSAVELQRRYSREGTSNIREFLYEILH